MKKIINKRELFTFLMVLMMVYCMTFYNAALRTGLGYYLFLTAFKTMWFEVIAAYVVLKCIAIPVVGRVNLENESKVVKNIVRTGITVSIMAPIMTLIVVIFKNGFGWEIPIIWMKNVIFNFPFALCIQMFYIGPFLRKVMKI